MAYHKNFNLDKGRLGIFKVACHILIFDSIDLTLNYMKIKTKLDHWTFDMC